MNAVKLESVAGVLGVFARRHDSMAVRGTHTIGSEWDS